MKLQDYIKQEELRDPKFKELREKDSFRIKLIKMIIKEKLLKGVTEEEIAKRTGLSLSTILNFEAGDIEDVRDCVEIGYMILQSLSYRPKPKIKYMPQKEYYMQG